MIKQISSHDMNQILVNAQAKLGEAEKELGNIKNVIANSLDIMHDENLWTHQCLQGLEHVSDTTYTSTPLYIDTIGDFSKYYCDVLPALVKEPLNVFNITSTQGVFFREDVKLSLRVQDSSEEEDVTDILKHDSLKGVYFHRRFTQKAVSMTITLEDYQRPLGASRFNILEVEGFMPGSFRISALRLIYDEGTIVYTDFYRLGKNRILLEEKKQIDRIEIEFELLNEVIVDQETYYPLALKHIYLLDADFKQDSYVIAKVSSDNYLELIQDECLISSNRGVEETTLKALGVEAYAHYVDNQLYMPVAISNAYEIYEIPLQIKALYLKIPLNKALSSIGVKLQTR